MRASSQWSCLAVAFVSLLFAGDPPPVAAGTASALIREGDAVPGHGPITSINNPVVNHAGGFAVTINTDDAGNPVSHVWGNASGGPGALILSEGTYGNYQQTSFETFHGFSDAGAPCYSPTANDLSSGATGLDCVWVSTTAILVEQQPVPTLPGQFSSFNSRPGITADGIPYWVGGITSTPGGATQNRVLFFGADLQPLLMGGDTVGGVVEPLQTGSFDFDYRFSRLGTHYALDALVASAAATDSVVVKDGNAVVVHGSLLREGTAVPAAAGGLPGENWQVFDYFGLTESGLLLVTGDTSAAAATDEFVFLGDQIVLREGAVLTTPSGNYTISGAMETAYLNDDGDYAVVWDANDPTAVNVEVLIVNGEIVLKEGDSVNYDGDGNPEPGSKLADFTGIASLAIADRIGSNAAVYFSADINFNGTPTSTDDKEGAFRLVVRVAPNQSPSASCEDVTVSVGPTCSVAADVDDGSSDPDGDPITLEQDPPGPYALGTTSVLLTATDSEGASSSCTATVTVVAEPLTLRVEPTELTWGVPFCDVAYDVVRGNLAALRASGGDFSTATAGCVAPDHGSTSVPYAAVPDQSTGEWFLARREGAAGNSTYDENVGGQAGPRDAGIAASGADCP